MTTAPPKRTEAETKARRAGIASFIGTTIEWYDFYIYGTASALVFGQVFFSDTLPAGMARCSRSSPCGPGSSPVPSAASSSAISATRSVERTRWSSHS